MHANKREFREFFSVFASIRGRTSGLRRASLAWILGFGPWVSAAETVPASIPISSALSPAEELSTFAVAPGLRVELIAADPLIEDPVAMTFDEQGRLWVVEMRGFMPDIQGTGEEEPNGRVSILIDRDGDGLMDARTVFLDGLVLPRAVAVVRGGALVAENKPLWLASDTDGDGRADQKTLIDPDYGGRGLPEHSANGLWRGLDNWYYNAKSKSRFRFQDGQWTRQPTEFRGQWGICHDDFGRLFYNFNWSQLHTDLAPPNYLLRNPHHAAGSGIGISLATNQTIFPIRPDPAVNRGYIPGALDESGRLKTFTSACAPLVYRGGLLPRMYQGAVFVCEPAGHLIKCNLLEGSGLEWSSRFAWSDAEFLASTDERFRPVFLALGPEGALYVVDMYRGVIQHRAHITPYLRDQSIARKLVEPIHKGRLWRILPDNVTRAERTLPADDGPSRWIEQLSHTNGWVRDTAQRLLVEARERNVVPALRNLALNGEHPLGRLHALWTLEGLEDVHHATLLRVLEDPHPWPRLAALRLLDQAPPLEPKIRRLWTRAVTSLGHHSNPEVVLHAALSAAALDAPDRVSLLLDILGRHGDSALFRDAALSSGRDVEYDLFQRLWPRLGASTNQVSSATLIEMLATAMMRKGSPREIGALLAILADSSPRFTWREEALFSGLAVPARDRTTRPIRFQTEPSAWSRLRAVDDPSLQKLLAPLARVLQWPGQEPWTEDLAEGRPLTRAEQKRFTLGRQQFLSICAGCHGVEGGGLPHLGPPLAGSEWVTGPTHRLARIVLQGLEGPMTGQSHRPDAPENLLEMPALAAMDNDALAAVLTYIRRAWGHAADPVSPTAVGRARIATQGRLLPWTEAELRSVDPLPVETQTSEPEESAGTDEAEVEGQKSEIRGQ